MKKTFALLLAVLMGVSAFAGCGKGPANSGDASTPSSSNASQSTDATPASYTYNAYSSALGNNWNPHTWETNADDLIQSYLSTPLATMSILDSENGVYQWIYEAATSVEDVTADHQDDLTKYKASLPEGQSPPMSPRAMFTS